MNVFEDLIGELKNENLLEDTIIDVPAKNGGKPTAAQAEDVPVSAQLLDLNDDQQSGGDYNLQVIEEQVINEPSDDPAAADPQEFYRKRAMDEVSSLQMVEHVLSGVEREQMRVMPRTFDDLTVKKCLHSFLQALNDPEAGDHTQIEFQLMQETESWCSALALRDADVTAAHLRRFCENSRPALSSQALISLAKFYRNLPYSEAVRNKFDFVVTRLFSKEIAGEKRYMIFGREEMVGHFKTFYAEWSSISLYDSDGDDSESLVAALGYEDFISEAERATSFDDLIRTQFFDRIRKFKEDANEMFFAPIITAAAVECNIRVGNRIVDLLDVERGKADVEQIYEKYGTTQDQVVSDATSRTTELADLLRERYQELEEEEEAGEEVEFAPLFTPEQKEKTKEVKTVDAGGLKRSLLGVNKWLLGATLIIVTACVGLYIWSERFAGESDKSSDSGVVAFNLEGSSLNEHLKTARVSGEVFYGITGESWDGLSKDKKEEFVQKIVAIGSEKGFKKVQLTDTKGKVVASASTDESGVKIQ